MTNDKRLIEDYLPIVAISAEASREKSTRKGHISTLHLWWARRPLVACRAAVYGALVPADRWVKEIELKNPPDDPAKAEALKNGKKLGLNRRAASDFVKRLCRYPSDSKPEERIDIDRAVKEAQQHILEAHAERLTEETGKKVTVQDIVAGKAPRPKVLDMFAGGGAIPLEALRLGCDAYANDLNPVAHIIELCTLVYPQKFGKPDPAARGMTGPRNAKGEATWGGLADEVRHWGEWVMNKVKTEIGDIYPLLPDPAHKGKKQPLQADYLKDHATADVPPGYLMPVAYLWTRTVTCKNPNCKATVPLVRQTWLCKKPGRYVALSMVAPRGKERARFEVVEDDGAQLPKDNDWVKELKSKEKKIKDSEVRELLVVRHFGFDPAGYSKGGDATCPFCGTVADSDYLKAEGCTGRMGRQMLASIGVRPGQRGKAYLSADDIPSAIPEDAALQSRIATLCKRSGLTVPSEEIEINPRSMDVDRWGLTKWSDLFTERQMLCLLTATQSVSACAERMEKLGHEPDKVRSVASYLAFVVDRLADWNSSLCSWSPESTGGAKIGHTFGRQSLPMLLDFCESGVWGEATGSFELCLDWIIAGLTEAVVGTRPAAVSRGSATALSHDDQTVDAVITDPPYYDNVSYSNLSDFFYVWLKRSIGHHYSEHFAGEATPKRKEAIAAFYRHGGDTEKSKLAYEAVMAESFREAYRVLKPHGHMAVVYAHKTTLGWATLVDAMRQTGFTVTEAWPLDTEMKARMIAMDTAALASSIFLVARKREGKETGVFDEAVKPELEQIVRERVETLWAMGISGADLVIACVGAGLRAFTRFARVEYANGEEVPAERFLTEVETVVLETILARLSKEVGGKGGQTSLAGMDAATRFYVLWRYTYGAADLDAGEAIIFANGTHVELEGHSGLASGSNSVLEKKKSKYRLRDYTDRGDDDGLGSPDDTGVARPVVDILHRLLWLLEHRPPKIPEFLADAQPSLEQLRLVCQALAGPALKGGELADISAGAEQSALGKLLANWSAVMEGQQVKTDRQKGQDRLL
jgi:putative DNA methylase